MSLSIKIALLSERENRRFRMMRKASSAVEKNFHSLSTVFNIENYFENSISISEIELKEISNQLNADNITASIQNQFWNILCLKTEENEAHIQASTRQ